MHPPLQELAEHLTQTREAVLAVWEALPPDTRERRPSPESWTPAEVIEHLRLTEVGSAALLAKRLQRAREAGLGAETDHGSRLRPSEFFSFVLEGPPRVAPDVVRPGADVRAAGAEAGLRASRASLDALMRDASGFALGGVKGRHPALGELDFYEWLLFIAEHERRHLSQLERLRDALTPATPA